MDHFAVAINELQLVNLLYRFHFNGSDGFVFWELERVIDISQSTNLPWYLTITQCKSKALYHIYSVHTPLNFLQSQSLQRLFALRTQLSKVRPALNWRLSISISATPNFTLPDGCECFLEVGHKQTIICFILLDVLLELFLELLDELLIIRLKSGFLLLTAQDLVFILLLDLSETVTKHTREGHLVGSLILRLMICLWSTKLKMSSIWFLGITQGTALTSSMTTSLTSSEVTSFWFTWKIRVLSLFL